VLSTLLRNAAQFADRAVLFVIKGDQAIAWRMCEAQDPGNLQMVSGVAVPLAGLTVVSEAARSQSAETASGTRSEDRVLIEQLGGDAQQLAALPLTVRGKVVAVLYLDSAWPHQDAIRLEALEVLTQVAGMAVELASPRATRSAQASTPAVEAVQPAEAAPAAPPETDQAEPEQPEESSYVPQIETQPAPQVEAQAPAASAEEPSAAVAGTAEVGTTAVRSCAGRPKSPRVRNQSRRHRRSRHQSKLRCSPSNTARPLGRSRRYGTPEADLPVQVNDEERRLHHDARRFARLLVSEIKLYNEQKVSEGRNQSDIYDRLRDDIDRSRQMYDKRVAPPVAARHDYFHQELVNTLAEGDPAKLGGSYPGAAVAV